MAYMMLNDITHKCFQLISETKHSRLKESPIVGPLTPVEPEKRILVDS